jgi:CBS domain-containing protein
MELNSYSKIKDFRIKGFEAASLNNEELNLFHDFVHEHVISVALNEVAMRRGQPSSPFCFFAMGSAGRIEQSIWSDQDHGMVFAAVEPQELEYFLDLGREISNALEIVGYKKCSGSVMASNPLWCKSSADWENQLDYWVTDSTWESIRHLLIFSDARSIYGESRLLSVLKTQLANYSKKDQLLVRMLHNTMHLKKGVGILGQLLVETHGTFSGSINLKDTAFFPYVNAVRLLAFYEGIKGTSTLSRISMLSENIMTPVEKKFYREHFSDLLEFRLVHSNHIDYDAGHYVDGAALTKKEKKILKDILRAGEHLYEKARRLIERM